MLRLKRSLLIVALVAVLSVAAGVGRTTNAEEPTSPTGGLAASNQSGVSSASQPETLPAVAVPGGPGFFSQPSTGFRPWNMSTQWAFFGADLVNTGTGDAIFESPASLPNGATINKVVWYYYDNSSSYIRGTLFRVQLDNGVVTSMASAVSTGAQNTYQNMSATTISNSTVDLQSYAYDVEVMLPPDVNVKLVGYRIDYQYPGYLPTVLKNSN